MNVSPTPADQASRPRNDSRPSGGHRPSEPGASTVWPVLTLLLLAGGYRVWLGWLTVHPTSAGGLFSWLPGFCPLAALTLCGGWFLPRRLALLAPLAVLLASDLALTAIYGWQPLGGGDAAATVLQMVSRYAVLGLLGLWALWGMRPGLAERPAAARWLPVLAATTAGSAIFYVVTNTFSWLTLPGYALTATGWWQALTTGLPGFPPSWIFFRNALVSDLLYAGVMLLAVAAARPAKISAPGIARSARPIAPAEAH